MLFILLHVRLGSTKSVLWSRAFSTFLWLITIILGHNFIVFFLFLHRECAGLSFIWNIYSLFYMLMDGSFNMHSSISSFSIIIKAINIFLQLLPRKYCSMCFNLVLTIVYMCPALRFLRPGCSQHPCASLHVHFSQCVCVCMFEIIVDILFHVWLLLKL